MKLKIIMFSIVFIMLVSPSPSNASWWNVDWENRVKNINVTASVHTLNITDATGESNNTHLYLNGSCAQAGCTDLINLLDNTTEQFYWAEGTITDTAFTQVFVKLTDSGNDYFYVNNTGATPHDNTTGMNNVFTRVLSAGQPVIGAWNLEGNALDSSGNGKHGAVNGSMAYLIGKYDTVTAGFDGIGNNVSIGSQMISSGDFSIGFWTKSNGTQGAYSAIISQGHGSFNGFVFQAGYPLTNLAFVWGDGSAWRSLDYGYNPSTDTNWYYLVATKSGNLISIYKNGTFVTSTSSYSLVYNSFKTTIGEDTNNKGRNYNGLVQNVRFYNRALTQDEITDIYNGYGYVTPNHVGQEFVYNRPSPLPTWDIWGGIEFTDNTITTRPATDINTDRATLHADIFNSAGNKTAWFEYGRGKKYIYKTPNQSISGGGAVSATLKGIPLISRTTFYYRGVVSDGTTTTYGNVVSFTTDTLNTIPDYDLDKNFNNLTTSNLDPTNMSAVGAAPYTDLMGNVFWGLLFAMVFVMIFLRQEDITLPAILGLIIGGSLWTLMPADWTAMAMSLTVVSFAGIVYSLIKGKQ